MKLELIRPVRPVEKKGSKTMKRAIILVAALAMLGVTGAGLVGAEEGGLKALRPNAINQNAVVAATPQQEKHRFGRAYRQQPPLIPHSIDQYQIDKNVNQCLGCHDWTNAGDRRAPTLSMTHYLNREGRQLDEVAGTRWFCNQCHVPQANAPALVDNTFQPSNASK